MDNSCRLALHNKTLRTAMLAALGLWLFCAGGCAMLPFAITTTASLALPQTASLAMTGVKSVYNTAYMVSDERDMNTMVRDNMLSLKAQSAMLTAQGSSNVHVYAYNGEIFAVGVVDSADDRDRVIRSMQNVKGVGAIKGYIRLRDTDDPINTTADNSLQNRARMALSRYLLHKNSGVEVQAVDGQLCLMGVVGTHAEALDIIQYVETVTGKPALSMLSIRDEYATGHTQTNRLYLLEPGEESVRALTLQDAKPLPDAPIRFAQSNPQAEMPASLQTGPETNSVRLAVVKPRTGHALTLRAARLAPPQRMAESASQPASPQVNKTRANMRERITSLAKAEANPLAKAELLALAAQVQHDRDLSITDRLSVAADTATQHQAKVKIQALLALL